MKKGIQLKLAWIGLVLILGFAVGRVGTLAFFSATTGVAENEFEAGTVTLGTPASTLVDIMDMVPDDDETKQYEVTYTGSADAWLLLDTKLTGDLTTCDGGKFSFDITDNNSNAYLNNALGQVIAKVTTGTTVTFDLHYVLDQTAGNDCQGRQAEFAIRVRAVQAQYNTLADNSGPILTGNSFEGDLSAWNVYIPPGGYAGAVSSYQGYVPVEGDYFALLKTDGPGSYTTLSREVTVEAGAVASGSAFFWNAEFGCGFFDDNAQVVIKQGGTVIATPWSASACSTGTTPWQSWSHTFASGGTYTIEAKITNTGDSLVDSHMGLDNVKVSK